jgi:hypothetical protein
LTARARWRRAAVAVATVASIPLGVLSAQAAPAGRTAQPVVLIFTGSVRGKLPARTATVVVQAQLASGYNAHGVPRKLENIPLAWKTITGTRYTIPVRESATVKRAERQGHGNVNFVIIATSGHFITAWFIPAVPPAPGKRPLVVRVPTLPRFRSPAS